MFGIDPATIPYTVDPVPAEFSENPHKLVENPEARVRAAAQKHIFDRFGYGYFSESDQDDFTWERDWYRLSRDILRKAFSEQELYRLWAGSSILSQLGRAIEEQDPLLWKVENCLWQYGFTRELNRISSCLEGLKRLHLDLPDFELRVTHTYHTNTHGWAEHHEKGRDLYLDAAFGLLFFYKGQHVLTCGFALTREGIAVAQIQLREKKGNRFLYKFPKHYVDFVLDLLGEAFGRECLWLVDGRSAVDNIRRSYGKNPCSMTSEDETRIMALYDRDLQGYVRTGVTNIRQGRIYQLLEPRT